MRKMHIAAAILTTLFLAGCGGGGSGSTNSGSGTTTPPPPPPPPAADFPLKTNILVRYQHGDSLIYSGRLKYRGDSVYQPYDYSMEVRDNFTLSNNPLKFDLEDGSSEETITYSRIVTVQTGEVAENVKSEVIQFQKIPSVGSSLFTYYEMPFGASYEMCTNIVNNRCAGRVDLLGSYEVGWNYNQQLVNAYFGWAGNPADTTNRWIPTADTALDITVESKEVVTTPLGRFEAYKVRVIKNVIPRNTFMYSVGNESINGYYWIHPAVGVVKADYVLTRKASGVGGFTEIYDVSYSISRTNITY